MSKIVWTKPHISNNGKNSFYVNRHTWPLENQCSGQVRLWQRPGWRLTAVWSFSWVLFPCLISFVSTWACPGALSLMWCLAPPSHPVFSLSPPFSLPLPHPAFASQPTREFSFQPNWFPLSHDALLIVLLSLKSRSEHRRPTDIHPI